jgi:hypothetical protein
VIDWFIHDRDWVIATIAFAALMPAFGCFIMLTVKLATRNADFKIDFFSPYKDGQLGYVALGWIAAALLELKALSDKCDAWRAVSTLEAYLHAEQLAKFHEKGWATSLACVVIAGFSALCAANGSVNPASPPPWGTKPLKYPIHYFSLSESIVFSILAFVAANYVHVDIVGDYGALCK